MMQACDNLGTILLKFLTNLSLDININYILMPVSLDSSFLIAQMFFSYVYLMEFG